MTVESSNATDETFQLYRKYQMAIHHDKPGENTMKGYKRFLCESPLEQCAGPLSGCGTYHIHYRVDGHLFAVSVIDVTPLAISSVYLFYDPDYGFLSPGTLTALKELELLRAEQARFPDFKYYYMGYYVHQCPKMRLV